MYGGTKDLAYCMARPDRSDRSDGHPDGSILTGVAANGPKLFWPVVDGFGAACGIYQPDTNLR